MFNLSTTKQNYGGTSVFHGSMSSTKRQRHLSMNCWMNTSKTTKLQDYISLQGKDLNLDITEHSGVVEDILSETILQTSQQVRFICEMESRRGFVVYKQEFDDECKQMQLEVAQALPETTSESEQIILARVCTYFGLASKRVVEVIPMVVELSFAKGFADRLRQNFLGRLKLHDEGGKERCEEYAREDPDLQRRRDELEECQRIVDDCLRVLNTEM
jgi:hypothetical protein